MVFKYQAGGREVSYIGAITDTTQQTNICLGIRRQTRVATFKAAAATLEPEPTQHSKTNICLGIHRHTRVATVKAAPTLEPEPAQHSKTNNCLGIHRQTRVATF